MLSLNANGDPLAQRFAIYARRSSDESSDKQYKSIPDQVKFCTELAEREGIVVSEKHVFTESASAKTAGNRAVFEKLITLIRKGEIDGIISWHPDRLSRNMLEAGIIIDLIDEGKIVDLKFCTHHFDNSASGKMMLGIMFAISKEYSDRLSVNISRGHGTNLDEGKSQGSHKWGYIRNPDGWYDKNSILYPIVSEIWLKRLRGESFDVILEWIGKMDVVRKVESIKNGKKVINTYTITRSTLTRMFKDPLYYGVLRQSQKGKTEYKTLSEHYPDFKPMVTEHEWKEVQLMGRSKVKLNTKQRFPFRDNLITCTCGDSCYPTTGQSDKLYLYIVCRSGMAHRERGEKYRLRSKVVIDGIADSLKKHLKPYPRNYERYVSAMRSAIENELVDTRRQKAALTKRKNDAEKECEELVVSALVKKLDKKEDAIYSRKRFSLEEIARQCDKDLAELKANSLLQTFDYEEFSNFLRNADLYWKKADAEQKHALARFLFSNITVGDGKLVTLAYKPLIKDLFVLDGGPGGT
jgi:DNA invertase Pin-like site-specific DNA recombinase